jgi:TDG/mug DNA glycosylase family protein
MSRSTAKRPGRAGNEGAPFGVSPRALDLCFPPIARRDADTLVLGSLPGRRSLEMQQYYAHPHNAFWKLISAIFDVDGDLPYAGRVRILTSNRIALWDVLAAAERPGSLDSSIVQKSVLANDFVGFFRAHPRIRRVFFNGRKAEEMYRRLVKPGPEFAHIQYQCLPSTSPAHAGMTFAKKLGKWRSIKESEK